MSHRLQVLIPEALDAQLRKSAQRHRISKGEWVRRALEQSVRPSGKATGNPLERLAALKAPTADIDRMLAEIEAGRK